ncbi:MAG: RsmF rRNA methyltransferase first C-terminal domain-containing protein [Bacteroidetes bacterium]|nr:RsmF rRNA methyltransferase first C-terminal domain-containing protein [Bacteroidota bacterium]
MELPALLIKSLQDVKGFNKEAFEAVHNSGEQITSIRLSPVKKINDFQKHFEINAPVPWSSFGYYLMSRPSFTFDPLFHAGCYYVQEASSMFLEQALKQSIDVTQPLRVLDLCAAPGGKSTHIQSLISDESLLVSNEVIRSRASILKDNIIKWGCENVVVTNNDPKDFSKLRGYFDVIVVDAPCSGSGLFRRDDEAINEWSENNVALCAQRQQRILADVWPALKKDGILIYSTCSYSQEEDEDIVKWLKQNYEVEQIALSIADEWNIVETECSCRFWPNKVKGEGLFMTVFRKKSEEQTVNFKSKMNLLSLTKAELSLVGEWVIDAEVSLLKNENTVYAWPKQFLNDFQFLLQQLKVLYSGVKVGELMKNKLVPDHALAMSLMVAENIRHIELNEDNAIAYLQRKEIHVVTDEKGWVLATYKDYPLGWMNILQSRINNYYPKELRILKERP